jgi:hypothetical protein
MEENMKIYKTIMAALTVAFLTTNCLVLDGGGSTDDGGGTTAVTYSEGSTSNPVTLSYDTYHAGSVDGTYSSYYIYYDSDYYFSNTYYFYLVNLTADADLECSNGDESYSSYGGALGGTSSESCYSYSMAWGRVMAVVYPYDTAGAFFDIYVW